MKVIEGRGRDIDRTEELIAIIIDAINENAQGMTVVAVLGCLEMVKVNVLESSQE